MTNFEKFKTLPLSQAAAFVREYISSSCWACVCGKKTCEKTREESIECSCEDGVAQWPHLDYDAEQFPWRVIEAVPAEGSRVCDLPEGTVGRIICESDGLFTNLDWYCGESADYAAVLSAQTAV